MNEKLNRKEREGIAKNNFANLAHFAVKKSFRCYIHSHFLHNLLVIYKPRINTNKKNINRKGR